MPTIKEFFKTRPNFYNVHNDDLYLICVVKNFLDDGYKIRIEKYYIVKEDFDFFEKIILNESINQKTRIPRVGCFEQVIETKVFKELFKMDFNLSSKKEEQEEIIETINEKLSSIVISFEGDRYKRLDSFERYSKLNNLLKVVVATNQTAFTFRSASLSGEEKKTMRLFNVWQANCSALYYGTKVGVVFDLGNKNGKNREPVTMLTKELANKNDGDVLFVISHFHDDHVNLANHIPYEKLDNALFVFPFTEKPNTICFKARLMILSAYRYGIPMFFFADNVPMPAKIGDIDLYKGSAKGSISENEKMNADGVIASFELGDKKILVPGDSLYEFWPKRFSPTHLIVPHHGCEYTNSMGNIDLNNVKEAFVSSKFNVRYHHPNVLHINNFKSGKVVLFSYKTDKQDDKMFIGKKRAARNEIPTNVDFLDDKDHINW